MRTDREDRVKGCMLASAAGDALGAGYETGKRVPASGATMCGGGFGFEPGEWTDDSSQAICVALGRSEPAAVAANLLRWYDSHPKDIGGQTRAVMSHAKTPSGLLAASKAYAKKMESRPVPRGFFPGSGNGGLMRTGPVCLPFLGDRKRIADAARKVSDLTHADAWSGDACTIWSLAISDAVELGEKWTPAMLADGLELIPAQRRQFWADAIAEALSEPPRRFRSNGSAVGCFKAALWAVAHATSLEEGLQLAVSIGGDTDTVAAVAGSLLGAIHGASSVPARWRKALHGWPGMRAHDLEALALEAAGS